MYYGSFKTCLSPFYTHIFKKILKVQTMYQRGNRNPYIEEEQTTQWPKEKVQKDKNDLQNIHINLKIK